MRPRLLLRLALFVTARARRLRFWATRLRFATAGCWRVAVRIYRAPHYPHGGMFGDHMLALARCPAPKLDVLGSAHGYQREDVSIAIAVNLARHPRCRSGRA